MRRLSRLGAYAGFAGVTQALRKLTGLNTSVGVRRRSRRDRKQPGLRALCTRCAIAPHADSSSFASMTLGGERADGTSGDYRVRILGATTEVRGADGIAITKDGEALCEMPASIEQRMLLLLAMRAGHIVPIADLVLAGWGWSDPTKTIQDKISHLRTMWRLTEIPPGSRLMTGYRLDLPKNEIDALHFIEIAGLPQPRTEQLDGAMALWRGDPRNTPDFPGVFWAPLDRAVTSLLDHVYSLPERDQSHMRHLERFIEVLGSRAPKRTTPNRRGRLLIVEDDPGVAETLRGILFDFECAVASNVGEAMTFATDLELPLLGAIVDRHLSASLDSAGLQVLAYLRDSRPDVPRILLTSDHPEGPDLDISQKYGVFEVVTKGGGGKAAPGIRDVVERMLRDLRAQATVRLEAEAARLAKAIGRKQVDVRRSVRQGGESVESQATLARLVDLQDAFEAAHDDLGSRADVLSDDGWRAEVDQFLSAWREKV
ncbi:MAG: transcriptional regulator, family, partial [Aeromicrobium sp.]|nr:transcriptional regulator, family [Aeromicrobium sp.]